MPDPSLPDRLRATPEPLTCDACWYRAWSLWWRVLPVIDCHCPSSRFWTDHVSKRHRACAYYRRTR